MMVIVILWYSKQVSKPNSHIYLMMLASSTQIQLIILSLETYRLPEYRLSVEYKAVFGVWIQVKEINLWMISGVPE